ncbi:TPA: hypothetical protein N0F65_006158 [Lagenidium giganteum]|uniref:Uncharacterized protein n=1 Tax=Lagenidium giganteum TaxID=4803 RepID=A0AAV2ZAL1_9STRA|nr:TPA: hypothetical protein N0F65_006158 [Lagenidium giganteum]
MLVNTKGGRKIQPWIWKQSPPPTYGFGMPISEQQVPTTTSTFRRGPRLHSACLSGDVPAVDYTVSGITRSLSYVLADGIYSNWTIFAIGFGR